MKNGINDLRNHMFAQLERLSDENLTEEQLRNEISRAQAISGLGKVIVESAKTQILHAKLTGDPSKDYQKFLGEDEDAIKPIERPAATYSNKSPLGLAK